MDGRPARMSPGAHDAPPGKTLVGAVARGLLAAFVVALASGAVVAAVLALTEQVRLGRSTLLLVNYLSVATGSIVAGRAARRRGWLAGGLVGLLYALLGLAISGDGSASLRALATIQGGVVSTLLGLLAGVIGVNL